MELKKAVKLDIDGTEAVTPVLQALLNACPVLGGKKVAFATLAAGGGIGFYPSAGAVFLENHEDITGHVRQRCRYPFTVVYRLAPKTEGQRLAAKAMLDALGRWLERQPVTVDGKTVQLGQWPDLGGNREFTGIERTTPGSLSAAYEDGFEDWVTGLQASYKNEFDR